ncbi:bZIP transcription factor 53-like [Chenopodium quinoa]|uniref:BZIP domain-containing protein n=1 Tax=Chenopodium quinoa TaxID=63459 RepID=A0A803N6P1_CHEQI|nr:bZIP transcription factor 53-like [Chenopodium quinoa]
MRASKTIIKSDGKSSSKAVVSSGSSGGCNSIDEKKRRRLDSNRESARRSREKKQKHLDNLLKEVSGLELQNKEIMNKIDGISNVLGGLNDQNNELKTLKDKLEKRLDALESVIEIGKVVRGSSSNINSAEEINNNNCHPMMKPWQLPCHYPSLPIFATSFKDFNV